MSVQASDENDALANMPGWLRCWMSKEEREKPDERPRWMGRFTFILAAIGSAIGLGNFWRFPYLTYKHGGAKFFFPWLCCLFVMGIPFMIMELALGQKFQRGDIAVFRGIDRRLVGIGVISVYSSYVFSWYYNVVVAWALVYFISGFKNPLPYSKDNDEFDDKCCDGVDFPTLVPTMAPTHAPTLPPTGGTPSPVGDIEPIVKTCPFSRAQQFWEIDVIRIRDDNCVQWTEGEDVVFSTNALGATLGTWAIIFFCVWKGVKSSSWIVWFTVPVPMLFVLIMIINNATLPGASDGLDDYFNSRQDTTSATMWADAAGQIFLGLSVCLGIMTSYGSYNNKDKPIIMDSVIISISNCSFSFVSGFAVWLVVGYLREEGSLDEDKVSGVNLAFITYPTAIDTMSAPNFWAVVLGSTLFMLGIDSSFSAIEATSTVICDTAWKGYAPRMFVAFVLCVVGALGSIPFCLNYGFILFDVVDHYLCAYLLNIIGILQAFGCCFFFDNAKNSAKSPGHNMAINILHIGYWAPLLLIGAISTALGASGVGYAIYIPLLLFVIMPASFYAFIKDKEGSAGDHLYTWVTDVVCCGAWRISWACSQMSRKDPLAVGWWEPFFVAYWTITVKFFNPMFLYFIVCNIFKDDIACYHDDTTPCYGGYAKRWQTLGFIIPFLGLVFFFCGLFMCGEPEKGLDYSGFVLEEEKIGMGKDGGIEMGDAGTTADPEQAASKGGIQSQ